LTPGPETQTQMVSAAQHEHWDRDGYLVLEDSSLFPPALDQIVSDVDDLYGGPHRKEDGVIYYPNRVQDAWRIRDSVRALATAPKVLALLAELYGRAPLPFQTLNFRKGTQQAPHSDALHFSTIPAGFMAGVWVALEDMDMDNGPVVYYPRSQVLPEATTTELGVPADGAYESYRHFEQRFVEQIEREGLEPQYATISKGQVLVWSANILHGGSPQKDKDRTRHSQVTHYFFEGCKYWTPLLSDEKNTAWRDPEWIT
jgi:hypothetical protein